ncbi:GGDEF domain-containing protein [Fusibacter paucivorans]|uniref:GGDEF domain-containing protein n=1 Tax=Fusibacter paucivorans TaxID=76009 RepID=A0ABS5PQC4_9FIRM|nr:GGDEF domain-containing protein [Fusibacter paucivorans]MBS7527365.1 GGDEF domain-containing protein [Fusibacter paucivorans]
MEIKAILILSAMLFGISFFMHTFIIPNDQSYNRLDFMPALALLYVLTQTLLISSVNAFRLMIAVLYLGYAIMRLLTLKGVNLSAVATGLIQTAVFFGSIQIASKLPIFWLNTINILLGAAFLVLSILQLRQSDKKIDRDLSEINVIGFIALLILSLSSGYYMLNVGTGVFCLHQLAELVIYTKHDRILRTSVSTRLKELENRFERTVEFEAKKRTSVMADKIEHIREKSQKDPMTKALNRHGLTSEINNLIRDPAIKIFSIAIFDIDHFKSINDTKGHIVGDECLKFLSYTFMISNRKTDMLGRYGGDEFILIMPHVNAPAALEICERMRGLIQSKSVPKFTISLGIATYPYDGRAFTSLLEVADKGLYKAKEGGRNRVAYDGNVFIKNETK